VSAEYDVYLIIEPDGGYYGFPKRIPEEYITWKTDTYYELSPFIRKWATLEGYPAINGKNVSFRHEIRPKNEKL